MDADEALAFAKQAAEGSRLFFTVHALERMQERLATSEDVHAAIASSDVAVPSEDGPNRWILCGGYDIDDCGLRVVVAIDDGVVTVTIVTIYPP